MQIPILIKMQRISETVPILEGQPLHGNKLNIGSIGTTDTSQPYHWCANYWLMVVKAFWQGNNRKKKNQQTPAIQLEFTRPLQCNFTSFQNSIIIHIPFSRIKISVHWVRHVGGNHEFTRDEHFHGLYGVAAHSCRHSEIKVFMKHYTRGIKHFTKQFCLYELIKHVVTCKSSFLHRGVHCVGLTVIHGN